MKNNRLKKYSLRFGIAFIIVIALLTYFSSTIYNMLLPKVKVEDVQTGYIGENDGGMTTKYLLPISSVIDPFGEAYVYIVETNENKKSFVKEIPVTITNGNGICYEATSKTLFSNMQVVYSTTKEISSGDEVYIEEE